MAHISDIKLIRTDTTLDLSQKAEKVLNSINWTAKLSSFSLSLPIPEGESGVYDMVCGTQGFAEPQYMRTGFVTENVDIYNLGFIMLSLLTGKHGIYQEPANGDSYNMIMLPDYVEKCLGRGPLAKLIDPSMLNSADDDIPDHSKLQMEAFVELALRCVRFRPEETKLHMIDVAKELKRIENQT
ncbi:predicted protein [Arabidopsis lyrata subsp. lyrata]|uniref:Predicted protein n=1 Tax=Arabidopsis lyrata subsp. lyrata TaxID=81972 RepID=D7LVW6_ARALL|nr:predicted protein [Arabidopsis lyrata subsp. lyrata]